MRRGRVGKKSNLLGAVLGDVPRTGGIGKLSTRLYQSEVFENHGDLKIKVCGGTTYVLPEAVDPERYRERFRYNIHFGSAPWTIRGKNSC